MSNCDSCNRFSLIGSSYTVRLKMPEWGGEDGNITKELQRFSFWSDNYAVHDDGIASQPFTLAGIETPECSDGFAICFPMCFSICFDNDKMFRRFRKLWEIQDRHEEVEVSGLGKCINGVYIIKGLSVDTIPGYGKYALKWSLNLEKVRDS